MKRLTLFAFIGLVAILMSFKSDKKATITWYDWNTGYQMATKKNKLMLIDVYTSWCGWCKKMDKDTYEDKEVVDAMNKNFIAIKLNPEEQGKVYKIDTLSLSPAELLGVLAQGDVSGYPTMIVVNAKQKAVIHKQAGYQDAATMKVTLANVMSANKTRFSSKKSN